MPEITESLRAELQRMLVSWADSTRVLRLARNDGGWWQLSEDTLQPGDVVIVSTENRPIMVGSQDVADALDGAILHFRARGDDRWGEAGLDVLRPRGGSARAPWSAPAASRARRPAAWASIRDVIRRREPVGSTTPTGSL